MKIKWPKEMLTMSRRERRGMTVVLAAIALLLAAQVAVRCCNTATAPATPSVIEQEADTAIRVKEGPRKAPADSTKRKKPSKPKGKGKQSTDPQKGANPLGDVMPSY